METNEEHQTYQLHESTPLAVAEVPECQPELLSAESLLGCGPGEEPPCSNGKVSSFGFWSWSCILVLSTELSVLVLEVGTDIGFRMLFKGLDPMEEAGPLLVLHGNWGVTTAINHPDCIPVCLSTIRHESLEHRLWNTVPCHYIIQVLPENHLRSTILELHIANRNGHHSTISGVVNVASHGGPILDTLDVIEHDPRVFQISSGLHSINQVHSRSGPYLEHLENKHLVWVRALTRELILLNVGLVATASERGDAVHDPKPSNIPECGDIVLDAWGAHIFALL
jgi:hypothetical protein